jgi:biopolymer transport protein ExbD
MRRAVLLLPVVLGFLGGTARGEEGVPEVARDDLPAAGTCAPIEGGNATFVTVGESGRYRLDGAADTVDQAALVAALGARAGVPLDGRTPSRHSVWIAAPAKSAWTGVINVIMACRQAQIFRVGLQVRSEAGEGLMGFPLFLPLPPPADPAALPKGKARRMDVRVQTGPDAPSDPRRAYAAAEKASHLFGPVVAEVTIAANVEVQYAVTVLDMLWRGGSAAVKLKFGVLVPNLRGPRNGRVLVESRSLPAESEPIAVPPIRARKAPWPDEGAAQPGVLALELEDFPTGGAKKEPDGPADEPPLPNYAAERAGVPATALRASETRVLEWSAGLGRDLTAQLKDGKGAEKRFAVRFRPAEKLAALVTPMRETFPGAPKVVPSTVRLDVYLFRGAAAVGKADVTVHLAGSALSLVFARWVGAEELPKDLVLPPFAVDPFAAGVPGHLRVWLEGTLASGRAHGVAGIPLTPPSEVLSQLPRVAHAGVAPALAARAADVDLLARWLAATPCDRLLLIVRDATASVQLPTGVVGILRYGLEPEEKDLRLNSLSPRAAR